MAPDTEGATCAAWQDANAGRAFVSIVRTDPNGPLNSERFLVFWTRPCEHRRDGRTKSIARKTKKKTFPNQELEPDR